MRRLLLVIGVVATLVLGLLVPPAAAKNDTTKAADAAEGETTSYVVLYSDGASTADGQAAIAEAGGTVIEENATIGLATVTSDNPQFLSDVRGQDAVKGAARDRSIATARPGMGHKFADERLQSERVRKGPKKPGHKEKPPKGAEPLSDLQWDMQMIGTEAKNGKPALDARGQGVLVGVIDTGIDGTHPDIAPNFSEELSRNFTTDLPEIDGPCEYDGCVDPANVDNDGHGTHVAGTIASPINDAGISGVAPEATLVNIRAGQDSGFFFLQPTVDALTYAAEINVDVVNMSFYVDPWLFNCPGADGYVSADEGHPTAEELAEQKTIYDAMHEVLALAHDANVTMIAAAGNSAMSLDTPTRFDDTSPDFPADADLAPLEAYARTVTDECLDLPSEGPNVMSVSSVGPSGIKADYSNYGSSEITVAAPGGYFRDFFGTGKYRSAANEIWAPYPESVALANGDIDAPGGVPNNEFVVQSCAKNGVCGYYQGIQGTSMASPHVVGVAALVISVLGDNATPDLVRQILEQSAASHPCPNPPTVDYTIVGRPAEWNATCTGTASFNNFYGNGLVDAAAAVALASTFV